jgi:putative ABC transport system substrate-binding protein
MKRRELITLLGSAVAWPLATRAQQPAKLPTIGFLGALSPSAASQWTAAFVQRLRELGWIEGRNLAIEYRWAEGHNERAAEFAAEFVRLKVDVIVTHSAVPVLAAKQATSVIPIVIAAADPVGTGLVAGLWRARAATSPACRSRRPILLANDSNSCARLCPVSAEWRSWPMSALRPPWWR